MNVLIVEDRPEDAFVIRKQLSREAENDPLQIEHVETLGAALERVAQEGIDCVLLDLGLPDGRGIKNLRRLQSVAPQTPIVILSGIEDERTAASAVQTGAFAYIVKRPVGQSEALYPVLQDAVSARTRNELSPALKTISSAGCFALDGQLTIRSWDQRSAAILHWDAADVVNKNILDFVAPARHDEAKAAFAHAGSLPEPLKLQMLLPDKRPRLVEIRPSNDLSAEGDRIWLITDAETSRRSLQAMQVLDVIMDTVSDAVFSQDLEGTIHSCSRSTAGTLGHEPDEIIGGSFLDLFPVAERPTAESVLHALKRGRMVRELDLDFAGPNDTLIPISLTLAPIRDEYGGLIGSCVVACRRKDAKDFQSGWLREKVRLEEMNTMLSDELYELRQEIRRLRQSTGAPQT